MYICRHSFILLVLADHEFEVGTRPIKYSYSIVDIRSYIYRLPVKVSLEGGTRRIKAMLQQCLPKFVRIGKPLKVTHVRLNIATKVSAIVRSYPYSLSYLLCIASSLRTQSKFDEDSPMHARLERWAVASEALSASLMLRRLRLFDVDTGFDLRRRAAGVIEQAEAMWSR